MIVEYLPLVIFFITYRLADLYWAVGACMASTLAVSAYHYLKYGKISPAQAFGVATMMILGLLTLWFRDERFIKWKPTIVYWALAIGFTVTHFVGKKFAMQHMLDQQISVPQHTWRRLNVAWVVFFLAMGCLNLWVAFQYDTSTWVSFKLFGATLLTLVFIAAQMFWLNRRPAQD
ncbi:MAG: septation protein A [Pseudomonadota bacterium]